MSKPLDHIKSKLYSQMGTITLDCVCGERETLRRIWNHLDRANEEVAAFMELHKDCGPDPVEEKL